MPARRELRIAARSPVAPQPSQEFTQASLCGRDWGHLLSLCPFWELTEPIPVLPICSLFFLQRRVLSADRTARLGLWEALAGSWWTAE